MSIESVGGMKQILNRYDTNRWIESADYEFKTKIDIKDSPEQLAKTIDSTKTFGQFLAESVGNVNDIQLKANEAIQKLATGESKNIHETMLVVEQADLAFKTMNQIRMKVIDAYKEIMKMQV
jgi:flagellar hook-basal body complex protein FliE